MNVKQTAPVVAALAPLASAIAPLVPVLLIGGAVLLVLDWLFANKDAEKMPETVPVDKTEIPRKLAETPEFRQIPAEIPAKPAAVPRPAAPRVAVSPPAVPAVPKIAAPVPVPAAVIVPKIVVSSPPPSPIKKKVVSREDMATVFQRGAKTLTRTAAVTALKSLGFGKTAAYAALSPDGRFSAWLHCAPDGIITWTDAQKT